MGHGKETPRQKMIGMMYLVLTALLALNVSKDVLNAFANIDHGINGAIENTMKKNEDLYAEFNKKMAFSEEKAKPYFDLAQEVRERADTICKQILNAKSEIAKRSAGEESAAYVLMHGGEHEDAHNAHNEDGHEGDDHHEKVKNIHLTLDLEYIDGKDNTDIPAEVLVGNIETKNGKGWKLKKEIQEFEKWILEEVGSKFEIPPILESNIKKSLSTADQVHHGNKVDWVQGNFEHLPLAGVVSILSGIENSIRNVETDLVKFLLDEISAEDVKVNALDVIALGSDNIIKGNEGEHQIFIAAYDSLAKPVVIIVDYTEEKDELGKTIYKYDPKDITDSLEIKDGRGIMPLKSNRIGNHEYKGLIQIKKDNGKVMVFPFEKSYTVAAPQAVVSATKMNVFYMGVDNPVAVSVPGVPTDKITAQFTHGRMTKSRKGGYIVKPTKLTNANSKGIVTVYAEIGKGAEKKKQRMGREEFRVKDLPSPIAQIGGKSTGGISVGILRAQRYVLAKMPDDFDFKLDNLAVTQFKLSAVMGGFVVEKESKSNQLTTEQIGMIKKLSRGQKLYIENIKAKTPAGIKDLPSIILKLQ